MNAAAALMEPQGTSTSVAARILVVEDEALVAMDLRESLEKMGYDVPHVVHSADRALEVATAHPIDLALVDIRMPGSMDGIDVAGTLADRHDIPVVFVTAYSDDGTLSRAKEAGPYGYLVKPVDERRLRTTIELALHRRDRERSVRDGRERYRRLFHLDAAARFVTDGRGEVRRCNAAFARLLAFPDPDAVSGHVVDPVDGAERTSVLESLAARGSATAREVELSRRDGSPVRILASARVVRGEDSGIEMILWTGIPVARREP